MTTTVIEYVQGFSRDLGTVTVFDTFLKFPFMYKAIFAVSPYAGPLDDRSVNLTFFHCREPLPVDDERSTVRLLHAPIRLGIPSTTTGTKGINGCCTVTEEKVSVVNNLDLLGLIWTSKYAFAAQFVPGLHAAFKCFPFTDRVSPGRSDAAVEPVKEPLTVDKLVQEQTVLLASLKSNS